MPSTEPTPRPLSLLTWLLLAGITILSLLVLKQSRQLRSQERDHQEALNQLASASLPLGEVVTPLDTQSPSATPSDAMHFDDGRLATAVFVFKKSCGACDLVVPTLRALAQQHANSGVRFVALQSDETQSPADFGPDITTALLPTAGSTWLRRVPLAPAMLLIDSTGTLREAWFGSPLPEHWSRMERAINAAETNGRTK